MRARVRAPSSPPALTRSARTALLHTLHTHNPHAQSTILGEYTFVSDSTSGAGATAFAAALVGATGVAAMLLI